MDVIVAGGPAGLMTAALPDLPGYRGLDTPFPFTLTLPQRGTGHAPAVFLDARGVRVRHRAEVTAARQSADEARARQKAPFTLAGLSATLTGISSTGFGAQPGLAGPDVQYRAAGRRQPGLERAATYRPPGLTCNAQRHGHPGRELRYHRSGKGPPCPPPEPAAGPPTCLH